MTFDYWERDDIPQVHEIQMHDLWDAFNQGDADAIFRMIEFCYRLQAPPPKWVVAALESALQAVRGGDADSIDEALGRPELESRSRRKSRGRTVGQLKLSMMGYISLKVRRYIDEGHKRDRPLFELIGALPEIGMSGSLVEKIYYEAERSRRKS